MKTCESIVFGLFCGRWREREQALQNKNPYQYMVFSLSVLMYAQIFKNSKQILMRLFK